MIHTVGPIWSGGDNDEDRLLAQCYRNSLALAQEHNILSIAFPAISAGVYSFPLERATRIALTEVKHFLEQESTLERVIMVCFSPQAYQRYTALLPQILQEPGGIS